MLWSSFTACFEETMEGMKCRELLDPLPLLLEHSHMEHGWPGQKSVAFRWTPLWRPKVCSCSARGTGWQVGNKFVPRDLE